MWRYLKWLERVERHKGEPTKILESSLKSNN